MEEKRKQEKAPLMVAGILLVLLIVGLCGLMWELIGKEVSGAGKQGDVLTPTVTFTPTPTEHPKNYTLKEVEFEVVQKLSEDAFIIWKEERYGMVDGSGKLLVEARYPYVEHYDEGWITFGDDEGIVYVYDMEGTLLYSDNAVSTMVTEDGIECSVYLYYKNGMKIEEIFENEDKEYYGIRYFNAETQELIFEADGYYADIAMGTLPDETGTAVVIVCFAAKNVIYKITKDGYTVEERILQDVATRDFYFSSYLGWTEQILSEGWLKGFVEERRGGLLKFHTDWRDVFYNIHTGEVVPFPERYQNTYADIYVTSRGLYFGITTLTEEEYYGEYPDTMYYAICHGSQVLTEEIYTWMEFDERYILAGNEQFAHVLDYDGNVVAQYMDMGSAFVDGTLVVYDEDGVVLVDEELEACTGRIFQTVNFCQPGFVCAGEKKYMIFKRKDRE